LHNAQPNILIIDDEETCLTSMELLLHDSKYHLIKTNTGQMGLKYIQDHHESISVVLLDLMMPDMYGLNLLNEIKNDPKLSNIPVILQTGSSDEEEIIKAFDKGIFCFIRKPYKKQVLLNKIEKALKFYNVNK
jgi:two-component system sensor histidine kinase ChiS